MRLGGVGEGSTYRRSGAGIVGQLSGHRELWPKVGKVASGSARKRRQGGALETSGELCHQLSWI